LAADISWLNPIYKNRTRLGRGGGGAGGVWEVPERRKRKEGVRDTYTVSNDGGGGDQRCIGRGGGYGLEVRKRREGLEDDERCKKGWLRAEK
jgi:hypothetical protein